MGDHPEVANVVHDGTGTRVAVATGGPCLTNTFRSLADGTDGRPMSLDALDPIKAQAVGLLEKVVSSYEERVASGEVGLNGSAAASEAPPRDGTCPTGLLYGRIQSGKTVGMIAFAALAIDNGFRVIVVLTSDNVKLVDQTASRFGALDAIVKNSTTASNWPDDADHIRKNLSRVALVLVCQKNQSHLASLVNFLENIGARNYPAVIMDDEADQATLDTTTSARASGRANAPKFASAINRRTVRNDRPDEAGRSVAEVLRHFVFVQVTATPYALLLQDADNVLRPSFTHLLEPGDGYTGGEHFFSGEHLDDEMPPLVFVSEDDSEELERGVSAAPAGLAAALAFFVVAAGAQAVLQPSVRTRVQNFLCHTSLKRSEHEKVAGLIRAYVNAVLIELDKPEVTGEIRVHLERAYLQLQRTVPDAPPLPEIVADLRQRLVRRQVIVVNMDAGDAEFSRGLNFIVGGNILGRGLTIENLLVTYYVRSAKVSQMDTMLQHARMFGYRRSLMPFTRVFLPERLALRFHRIHTAEQHLRDLVAHPHHGSRIPVEVSEGLRATRPAVLNTGSILAYTPGQHLYPASPLTGRDADRKHRAAKAATLAAGGTFPDGEHQKAVPISIETMAALIALMPYDDSDEDTWDPKAIQGVLESNRDRFRGAGLLYCRQMRRTKFRQGALSGDELKELRDLGRPVLCVFLDVGRKFEMPDGSKYEQDFVYPSFVLPDGEGMPAHVFNVTT